MINQGKEDGASSTNIRFEGLLQNFSNLVAKQVQNKEFLQDVKHSEELILSTVFAKHSNEPLERYLCISPQTRLNALFESLRPYDIVVGKVISVVGTHISAALLYVADGQRRYISDLNIVGNIESSDVTSTSSDDDDDLKVGDKVKGVITHVDRCEKRVCLSFDEKHLGKEQIKHFPLGKLGTDEEDDNFCNSERGGRDENRFLDSKSFLQDMEKSSDFVDPHSIKRLLNNLKLPEKCISFLGNSIPVPVCENVEEMREKQSAKWSMDMVGVGVKHFREQRLKEAMKCFDQSISFYPKNVEAYVARGALRANRNELKEAVEDFREALKLNPKHRNAKKYIVETLTSIAKRYEKDMKWKDASRCYRDILDVDAANKDALRQYSQIKQLLLPKKDNLQTPQRTSPEKTDKHKTLSVKSKERINKLKELLQAETKRNDDSSSSSSSSSSDSDSSSDEAWVEATKEVWVEKTKDSGTGKSLPKKRRKDSSSFDTLHPSH